MNPDTLKNRRTTFPDKLCLNCPTLFKPWRANSKFCSKSCANKYHGSFSNKECAGCFLIKDNAEFRYRLKSGNINTYVDTCSNCRILERKIKKVKNNKWEIRTAYSLYHGAKARCGKNNLDFNLTLEDIIIPDLCPVFGLPFNKKSSDYFSNSMGPSIDRINPDIGYIKGNIVIVSCRANSIKNNATINELIQVAEFYKKFQGQ